jgi:two-component system nitrogen regulation response regulator GlnG
LNDLSEARVHKLLVIDDEPNIAYTVSEALSSKDLTVISAGTAHEGIEMARTQHPDAVLLDVRLPDMSGLDAFLKIHQRDPRIPIIIMTAFSRTETAIEAMGRGAFEYLVKPVDLAVLRHAVKRAIDVSRLSVTPAVFDDNGDDETKDADRIVGNSLAMQEVYKSIGRVASQDVTVLITGESGTGKELAARAIYHYSQRRDQPFLAVNCAALTESLLESELFGHEKGAFTGADQRRIGKFEQVNGGTIFLDEIGDMSPSTQAKALRLLQQQSFERVGGNTTIQTNVRIIAATNRDLEAMVAEGQFRQDLFYRLSGFTIHLPPVRERKEDIPVLTNYFIQTITSDLDRKIRGVTEEARQILQQHDWPGNVRELHSALRYAIVQAGGEIITPDSLPNSCRTPGGSSVDEAASPDGRFPDVKEIVAKLLAAGSNDIYRAVLHEIERLIVDQVLEDCRGNQMLAAERLGISRMTLRSKIRSARLSDGE